MDWEPCSRSEIEKLISGAVGRMEEKERRLWELVRVEPEKWQQHPYGDQGDGFWIVATLGRTVVYFNDIEDGFNRSTYSKYGIIDDYWCNQDQLEWVMRHLIGIIESDRGPAYTSGPPEPLSDRST